MNPVETGREHLITRAFVSLADTLVDEYDVIELLNRLADFAVQLLPADAAGISARLARRSHRPTARDHPRQLDRRPHRDRSLGVGDRRR